MTRLASLSLPVAHLTTALATATRQADTRDARRYRDAPWRRWYGLKRWKDLRWQVLVDALFQCVRCGKLEGDASLLVADHIRPHRGRSELFWDRNNLQCMCKECHDTIKQREEQAQPIGVWD